MKLFSLQKCLLIGPLFLCLPIQAQTLTCATTCPQAGKVYSIRTASPVIGAGGQNVLWNFSAFTDFDTKEQPYAYLAVAATPQGSLFPQADIAMKQWNGLYYYMNQANDGILVAYPSSVTVNEPEMILPLPFSYGKTYTQTIVSSSIDNGDTMVTYKYKTIACVGTGTMVLPWMTFNNTLKIETKSNWVTFKNNLVFGYGQKQTEHTYYSRDFKHRIVYYRQRYEDGPRAYEPYTELYWGDVTGIESIENESSQIAVTPNPSYNEITLTKATENKIFVYLYSSTGALLVHQELTQTRTNFDVSDLPRGVYFLRWQDGTQVMHKKIVLE